MLFQISKNLAPVLPKESGEPGVPTIGDVKRAIPAHLFQRSLARSLLHLAVDLFEAAAAIVIVLAVTSRLAASSLAIATPAWWLVWIVYWIYQGATFTGLWVLAHECGHGGFSDSTLVNDTIGYVLHTMLFVPYAAWQASHAKHHHYTNNMEKDEPFVPSRVPSDGPVPTTPSVLATAFNLFIMLTIGWPLYIAVNASGPAKTRLVSHFDPHAPIFSPADAWKIHLGNAGLVAWTAALVMLGRAVGPALLLALYLPPLLITNMWLVSITYLQHTDADVPHYDAADWNWLRGAVATVDRTLGGFLDYKLHHIVDSHVCHHMFSSMPFYNAVAATPYVKQVLGKYYVQRGAGLTDFGRALWKNVGECQAVHGKGVLHFVMEADEPHGLASSDSKSAIRVAYLGEQTE